MTAGFADEPALDDEPAWCPPARDRATEINQAVREAVTTERERIRQLAIARRAMYWPVPRAPDHRPRAFADLLEETPA